MTIRRWIALAVLFACCESLVHADIYEWEYVDPNDISQGIQQSMTLVPDGAGLIPAQGLYAYRANLTRAYLLGYNLSYSNFQLANLTDSSLVGANLTGARLYDTNLTGADFTDAIVREADFTSTRFPTLTSAQLYSTASHQSGDLTKIQFGHCELSGWDFSELNMTDSRFNRATLATVNFSSANLYSAYFKNSVLSNVDFSNANLNGAEFNDAAVQFSDFTNADLTGADFGQTTLDGSIFTGAVIRSAKFDFIAGFGFSAAQLYSTASYQSGELYDFALGGNDLTGWNFAYKDLTSASFTRANLTDADFRGANLFQGYFSGATLTNVDFTGCEIRESKFYSTSGTGLSAEQLYSTLSYQSHDLTGIELWYHDLSGWDFAGQNLTDADFYRSTLSNTQFDGAIIGGADFSYSTSRGFTAAQLYSTASYQSGDLTGVSLRSNDLTDWSFAGMDVRGAKFDSTTDSGFTIGQFYSTASYQSGDLTGVSLEANELSGWDFAGKNLIDASFENATLVGTDFNQAIIRNVNFSSTVDSGFTATQFYSTFSYQFGDLTRIQLANNDLTGWDLAGKDLTSAFFNGATLNGATFANSDLRGSVFTGAILENADFSGANATSAILTGVSLLNANLTGADFRLATNINISQTSSRNFINRYGDVAGLYVFADETLRIWDFHSWIPVPIVVDEAFSLDATGKLRLVFEDGEWGSTLHFAEGIPVSLAGTLELLFDDSITVASLIGTTFQIFDWTGIAIDGEFDAIVTPGANWDTSELYVTGNVTLLSIAVLPGDYNADGVVDASDYTVWRDNIGAPAGTLANDIDGGFIGTDQYATWRANFGATAASSVWTMASVPEPATLILLGVGLGVFSVGSIKHRRR